MKISLEGMGGIGYLRCPIDGRIILSFQGNKFTLQDCEHYHWHLVDNNPGIPDIENGVKIEKTDVLDDWEEYLKKEHVGIFAIDNKWLYLMQYTEKVWEPR